MTRQIAIPCSACGRKFGGQQTLDRHKHIAGDRYGCYPNDELRRRGFYRDGWMVWHRGANPDQTSLLGLSEAVKSTPARQLARATDPETSQAAALAIAPRTGTLKAVVLGAYADSAEPLSDRQVAARLGLEAWQVSKRVSELLRDGLIRHVDDPKGQRGVKARVCTFVAQEATA